MNVMLPSRTLLFLLLVATTSAARAQAADNRLPSREELQAAVAVVERYLAATAATAASSQATATPKGAGDITAVQGSVPDASGDTRGVHGIAASADGVGVMAENIDPNGFDLRLAGPIAALLSEHEWRLDSGTPQFVDFTNPSGAMSLRVQGATVVTTLTDQNTTYAAGNQLSLAGTIFNVTEGAGSGLDADTVDGLHAAELVGGAHDHFGQTWSDSASAGLTISTADSAGSGIHGINSSASGFNHGVRGSAASSNGRGVFGEANAMSGGAFGVFGISYSVDGSGVHGRADATSGPGFGVFGRSRSAAGVGGVFVNDGGGLLIAADNAAAPNLNALEFAVDNVGNVSAQSYAGDGSPLTGLAASLFDVFGGDGSNGARVVSGTESVPLRAQYTTLTLNTGSVLRTSSSDGRAYIAVQGRCIIRGTLDGRGRGAPGGSQLSAGTHFGGLPGRNAMYVQARTEVPGCISGAGGGGGSGLSYAGGNGGGGEGGGGAADDGAEAVGTWKRVGLTGGSSGLLTGATKTDGFARLLACPGAGGGSGATYNGDGSGTNVQGGGGGAGGAVIYLECGEFEFVAGGALDARGTNGGNATCSGTACTNGTDAAGGGGGGGGGVVLVRTRSVVSNAGVVQVSGGAGGNGAGLGGNSGGTGASGFADIVIVR